MIPELRTARLLLRAWRDTDRAPYAALNADPEVMRHFPSTLTREQSDAMVDTLQGAFERRGYGLWAAERLDTSSFIGFVGLSSPSWVTDFTPCVEVGWRLAREHWGHGLAPEAANAALDFAFAHVDLPGDEVVSFTTTQNLKSRRVMEKIGMRHDAARDFDHPLLPDWVERAHVLYCMSRAEHMALRDAPDMGR